MARFYYQGMDDLAFVIQCASGFIPIGSLQYHISLHFTVKCFIVGTHSRCLNEWVHPSMAFSGFFHHVEVIFTKGDLRKMANKRKSPSLMAKGLCLTGILTIGGGWKGTTSRITPLNLGEIQSSKGVMA